MIKLISTLGLGLMLSGVAAHATVSFSITADGLQTATAGDSLPVSGSVFLVADTAGDSFGEAVASVLAGGLGNIASFANFLDGDDDLILWRSDLSLNGLAGFLADQVLDVVLGDYMGRSLDVGDALALVWVPMLDSANDTLAAGMDYGLFTSLTPPPFEGGSWIMPADGTSYYELAAYGDNGFYAPGSTPAADLVANLSVGGSVPTHGVPDSGSSLVLSALSILGLVAFRRVRK